MRGRVLLRFITGCGLTMAACAPPTAIRYTFVSPKNSESVSFLGDTLWSLPLDAPGGPRRFEQIMEARGAIHREPNSLAAQLTLARATVALGRLREAADVYSNAIALHWTDPRPYSARGEIMLWLREPEQAARDLQHARMLMDGLPPYRHAYETFSGPARETTLQFRTALLQGLALYTLADYAGARAALFDAVQHAASREEISEATLWLFFALARSDSSADIAALLAAVTPDWAPLPRPAALDLLLAFKGVIPPEEIRARALEPRPTGDRALYAYGIAFFVARDSTRLSDAEAWLDQAVAVPNWSLLPRIVAEAELGRLRHAWPPPRGRRPDSPR